MDVKLMMMMMMMMMMMILVIIYKNVYWYTSKGFHLIRARV